MTALLACGGWDAAGYAVAALTVTANLALIVAGLVVARRMDRR